MVITRDYTRLLTLNARTTTTTTLVHSQQILADENNFDIRESNKQYFFNTNKTLGFFCC